MKHHCKHIYNWRKWKRLNVCKSGNSPAKRGTTRRTRRDITISMCCMCAISVWTSTCLLRSSEGIWRTCVDCDILQAMRSIEMRRSRIRFLCSKSMRSAIQCTPRISGTWVNCSSIIRISSSLSIHSWSTFSLKTMKMAVISSVISPRYHQSPESIYFQSINAIFLFPWIY